MSELSKLDRQLIWAASHADVRCVANTLLYKHDTTTLTEPYDGTEQGLLDAIDRATDMLAWLAESSQ